MLIPRIRAQPVGGGHVRIQRDPDVIHSFLEDAAHVPGGFADVAVFDPATIADRATFEKPHQYAVGMKHVFVNGRQVLRDGEHTGALPGRALSGARDTRNSRNTRKGD